MKVIINETGVTRELTIIDSATGCEWTADLTSDDSNFDDYDREEGCYHISQSSFDFWNQYISDTKADEDTRDELCEIYDRYDVDTIIAEEIAYADYEHHHDCRITAFDRIRAELKPID